MLRWSGFGAAIAIFSVSRLIVFFAILFAVKFVPPNALLGGNDGPSMWHYLLRWDSLWYLAIMRDGYHYLPDPSVQQTPAFFPLYPGLAWCVARISPVSLSNAALLVSNAASIAAVLLLFQYVREHHGTRIAYGAVALFSFFPASIFLSAGYSESLTMALTMAAFLDLGRARPIRASVWSGLLTATRPTGVAMLAPLAYCLWPGANWTRAATIRLLLGLSIACSGLLAFAVYLGWEFNAPLAFAASQNHWYPGSHWSLAAGLHSFVRLTDLFHELPLPTTLDPWMFVGFAAVIFAMRSQMSLPELLFAGAAFGLLVVIRLCQVHAFGSMSRFMLVVFPAYIATAKLLDKRPGLMAGLCALMALGLFCYTALFAQWHWVE